MPCNMGIEQKMLLAAKRAAHAMVSPFPTILADKFCRLQGMQAAKPIALAGKIHRFNDLNVWRESR